MRKLPIACTLPAEELSARQNGEVLALANGASLIERLPNGARLQFEDVGAWFKRIAMFVDFERACCAFLRFEIAVEPGGGPLSLTLSGDEDAATFIHSMLPVASVAHERS